MPSRTSFARSVDRLLALLVEYGEGNEVVANPWVDEVPGLDRPGAAAQRIHNLRVYLDLHREARWMLVGQEAGYAGCRFSGIPFTSEDMLEGDRVHPVFAGQGLRRTSAFDKVMTERSARIVWPEIGDRGIAVLWNSFPFHCHERGQPLTNRAWRPSDDRAGLSDRILRHVVENLYPGVRVVAVGRKAEATLGALGVNVIAVRHPSQGGAAIFRARMAELLGAERGVCTWPR
jgi:hypothetical protein